jgi:glucosylceramidase
MKRIKIIGSGLLLVGVLSGCSATAEHNKKSDADQPMQLQNKIEFAEQYITARGTNHRLSNTGRLTFSSAEQPDEHFPTLIIDPAKTCQTIVGFGGALTDASAETFYKLSKKNQEKIVSAYFSATEGIGYNLFRTHINSCDFSSESYAYSETYGDINLDHFSINRDKKYRIPLIKTALENAGENFKLLASPWSPPAWMKTNNHMLRGGKLKPEYYQSWADFYVKFIESYGAEGIPVWGLTIQNEPMAVQRWESCIYTAEEERDFVKSYLGPTLVKNKLSDIKVIAWDHNRGIMYQRAKTLYDDPEAEKYIWGIGFHWYTGDHFENVEQVAEAFPDKKLLFTEGCLFPFNYEKLQEWSWGERYGESVIHDLNNYASGWIDWNILLNENGGPNHVANFCYAPVIGNTQTDEVIFMNSYYYLGHFSKFIRPGAKRIICSSNHADLLATAAINRDNSIAVVVMNKTDNDMDYKVWMEGKDIQSSIPAHSIKTLIIN